MLNSGLTRPQEGPSSDPGQPSDYWISRGLVYLVESNGVIWTRKGRASRIIGSGGPKLVPTKFGMAMGYGTTAGTGATDRANGQPLARSAGFRSIVSFSYAVSTGGGGFGRISQPTGTTGAGANDESFYINGTTSKFQYNRINSAGTGGAWHIAGAAVTGAWKCYGVTHDQTAVGNTPAMYEDGLLATTTVITASTGAYSVATYTPTFGNRSTDNARGWDGWHGPQIIFDHPYAGLTAAEHKWLFEDPARIYETPPTRVNWYAQVSSSGSTGTVAYTNANDTSAASGATTVVGTLAGTNGNDTSAASGTTTVLGTLATTNANDTVVASGTAGSGGSTGTVATTNANDTAAAAGTTTVTGTLARTNADDSVSAAGWAGTITGTLATTNANDSVIAAGTAESGVVVGRRRTSQRKILVTIKGARFLVPEDQLDEWLDDKEEEIVEQAIKPVTVVSKKARVIRANTSPVPKVAAQADEAWVAAAVAELNRRVQQRIADERKRLQDEDDEEVMLLLL